MKSKVVAALLSALVLPGAGQFYLRRRARAWLFLLPALLAGMFYLSHALDQANALADQLLSGKMPLDPAAIEARVEAAPTPLSVTISGVVFVVCWVGSVLEALLVKSQR
jgi:hypothetical protein